MLLTILWLLSLVAAFIVGILFGRRNRVKVETVISVLSDRDLTAQEIVAKLFKMLV